MKNEREFNKVLRSMCTKVGILDQNKVKAAPNELRNECINFVVRNRGAIVKCLINSDTDMSWLASMGYLYHAKNGNWEYLCTSENVPKNAKLLN
jgi:hypothetical protein